MLQKYLLSTQNKICLDSNFPKENSTKETVHPSLIYALNLDIMQLGYKLSKKAFIEIQNKFNKTEFLEFRRQLIQDLREIVGTNVIYNPLFRNFPRDVPEDEEYFIRRLLGFFLNFKEGTKLSCGHVIPTQLFDLEKFGACPVCQMQVKELSKTQNNFFTIADNCKYKEIDVCDILHVSKTYNNLLASKTSISQNDKDFIKYFIHNYSIQAMLFYPDQIEFKENIALLVGEAFKVDPKVDLSKFVKTSTDILRIVVQLCGGDTSLAKPCRIKLSNPQRRFVMQLMQDKIVDAHWEEALKYRNRWLVLGEVLHIGKYADKYPIAYAFINKLRNNYRDIETFNSIVAELMPLKADSKNSNLVPLIDKLKTRPGIFARKLNELLVKYPQTDYILTEFHSIIDQVTTKQLLIMRKYFSCRNQNQGLRYFMPKGSVAKIYVMDNDNRPLLSDNILTKVNFTLNVGLLRRFAKLEKLPNIVVDESLKNYLVPFSLRNSSKTSNPMVRGSAIGFNPEAKVLRLFMYWHENRNSGRIDVDLTAGCYDDNWNYKTHLSWTHLSDRDALSVHSGDIQSAPNGASEFIDLNLEGMRNSGVRYIVANVYSYTGQTYNTFECFAGIMEKENLDKNELYNPTEVKIKFDLTAESVASIPLIIDLETKQLIWADLATKGRTLEYSNTNVVRACKAIAKMQNNYPSLYDLFELHKQARNKKSKKTQNKKLVETRFDEKILLELDKVVANYI